MRLFQLSSKSLYRLLLAGFLMAPVVPAFALDAEMLKVMQMHPRLDGGQSRPTYNIPRETVDYNGPYTPGTIVVATQERRLYLVLSNHKALKYAVGVPRPGFEWSGTERITQKRENPTWTPPASMRRRRPDLPISMKGGPNNPLGIRTMYLGNTLYRIHGSNEPASVGHAESSGCIRMTNADSLDLYNRVKIGTVVHILR